MNNELQQHKKSDTVKWILTFIAFILVGIMIIGIILGWFERKKEQSGKGSREDGGVSKHGRGREHGTRHFSDVGKSGCSFRAGIGERYAHGDGETG